MVINGAPLKRTKTNKHISNGVIYAYPIGVIDTGAAKLWDEGYRGNDVKVAVIDSGILQHSDLNNSVVFRKTYEGDPADSHGTHVAGTIAAAANGGFGVYGIAPNVKLYDYQVLGKNGGSERNFMLAVNDAIEKGVDIINASLATSEYNHYLERAVKNATGAGIIVVAAAGNRGTNTISYPSVFDGAVAVASYDVNKRKRHKTSATNKFVDIVAPGVDILSTADNEEYAYLTGTSMATPHVSGILALLIEKVKKSDEWTRTPTKQQIRKRALEMLYSNVIDIPSVGRDNSTGHGKLGYNYLDNTDFTHLSKNSHYYVSLKIDDIAKSGT